MITIDRSSRKPVLEQLKEQLRYALATGAFAVDTRLPSTRVLADQLHLSFHTVRKAYQELAQEGLLEPIPGSGFRVLERNAPAQEDRMEEGAAIVHDALQRLIGLGLEESEIEYLLEEQLSVLERNRERPRVVFAAPYLEMAESCAGTVGHFLQARMDPIALSGLSREHDAEYVLTPHTEVRQAMDLLPQSDVVSATVYLSPGTLDRIARLRAHETLGVVSYYAETLSPLMREIQESTGFEGQMFGAAIDQGARHILQLSGQLELLVYTPRSRRRLLQLRQDMQHVMTGIDWQVARDSLDAIRQAIPT